MAKENKLAVKEETSLAPISSDVPDYLQIPSAAPRGGENVNKDDIVMPRLALASKQSPQVDENNERYIPGLKLGQFFNTITRENYGSEIYVVPLFELNTRTLWPEYGDGAGNPLCVSYDGKTGEGDPGGSCAKCKMAAWTPSKQKGKNNPPECTKYLNFATLVMPSSAKMVNNMWNMPPRLDSISIFGFKSTSYKSGQEWITMLRLRNRDWFAGVYKVTSAAKTDGKNSWHIPIVANAGWLPKDAFAVSEGAYENVKALYASGAMKVDQMERDGGGTGEETI